MSESTPREQLTTTSYAVLGLLCIREWSAYDLVQEMERGWADIWPRAVSGIYREPKKLVAHGYAARRTEHHGRRARTVYAATPAGREAFRAWLASPAADPKLEAEALVRAAFAEHGSADDLRVVAQQVRAFAVERSRLYLKIADEYAEAGPRFPERLHSILLVAGFLGRYFAALIDWADWVEDALGEWDDVASAEAVPNLAELGRSVREQFEANVARG